jgi:hypothetical protein
MARTLSPATVKKLDRVRWMIAALPRAEQERWRQMLAGALTPTTVAGGDGGGLLDGVKVIRPGEPGFEEARAQEVARLNAAQLSDVEWDLAFANWLDKVYGAASNRVAEVSTAAMKAARDSARAIANEATSTFSGVAALIVLGAVGGAYALSKWRST